MRYAHLFIKTLIISVISIFQGNLAWEVQVGVTAFAVSEMAYASPAAKSYGYSIKILLTTRELVKPP